MNNFDLRRYLAEGGLKARLNENLDPDPELYPDGYDFGDLEEGEDKDVEKAIDYAFSEQKFVMNFYQYLKGKEAKRAEAKQFLESSTAINLKFLVEELDEYLEGGQDEIHKNSIKQRVYWNRKIL